MAYVKLRPRRSTSAEWKYNNPVLTEGEIAIEIPSTGVGTGFVNVKFGDGVTRWNDIPYGLIGDTSKRGEYSDFEDRLNVIESDISNITPKLVVLSPDISLTKLDGTKIVDNTTIVSDSDIKVLDSRTKAIEDEIESLQSVLLLFDDAS